MFVDTIVICTLTALVILCSDININYGQQAGAELTIGGFVSTYGPWVSLFTALALVAFAFSTILGWGLYGSRCIEFIFGSKSLLPFTILYSLMPILGATVDLSIIWGLSDTFNGMMVVPNLIGVLLLSGTVFKLTKDYFNRYPKYKDTL